MNEQNKRQPAAAPEAVAWRDDVGNLYPSKESVDKYLPRGRTVHALYAAPVTAAPADDEFQAFLRDVSTAAELVRTGGQSKKLANRLREEVGKRQVPARRKTASTPAAPADTWFADQLTAMGEVIPLDSTPAAPGIDPHVLARDIHHAIADTGLAPLSPADNYTLREVIRSVIDASPKGAADEPLHAHYCNAQPASAECICGLDSPKGGSEARDAARWRYVRRKLCLTGNGDGTCGMQAINLPGSIPGWPDTSDDVVDFCEAAIDAAMQAQASDAEVRP